MWNEIISINGKKYIYETYSRYIFDYDECILVYSEVLERIKTGSRSSYDGRFRTCGYITKMTDAVLIVNTNAKKYILKRNILRVFKQLKSQDVRIITQTVSFVSDNKVIENPNEYPKIDSPKIPEPVVEKMEPPKENINLCFVGGVSTGKSTVLNAVFCEQLTQCKIKRTTMVPTIYVENDETFTEYSESDIFKTIAEKNKEMIEKTENGERLSKEDYKELTFNVGKLDINILPDSFVNVYDIPGLNDARTKNIYYEYLETNFHKFNLVLFLVDIHSGLNTSDEIDILNFITNNTKHQLETNNRKIYTLVIVNKADDMQLNEETNQLEFTGELKEMYEQVEKTICDEFSRKDVSSQLIDIIPLCAIDAYLYRMVKKHGRKFKLSPEQILKIGINENGKKFSTLKPDVQEKKVYEILNDETFIDTMIQLSGFGQFEKQLHDFLNENGVNKQIRIDNILYEMRYLPNITEYMHLDFNTETSGWFSLKHVDYIVNQYCTIYHKIKKISETEFMKLMGELYYDVEDNLIKVITSYKYGAEKLLLNYNLFKKNILIKYLDYTGDEYPAYLKDKVINIILSDLDSYISTIHLIHLFDILTDIDMFNEATCKKIMLKLMMDQRKERTIDVGDGQQLINLFDNLVELKIDIISPFIRFIIINQLHSNNYNDDVILYKKMLYYKKGEIPIYHYLNTFKMPNNIDAFVIGVPTEYKNEYLLDTYYLDKFSNTSDFKQQNKKYRL
jgi:GTP-binding protein EngB required for normal cell division